MKSKFTFVLLLILSISFTLVACTSADSGTPASTDPSAASAGGNAAAAEPTSGGTLRIAAEALPATLDPHTTTANVVTHAARQIFEPLVALDTAYQVQPVLAESYERSEDGKTTTFKLRSDIQFHNGKVMTADDVIASMEKWQQGATAKANLGNSTWEKIDDLTVVLHAETPSSLLMYALAEMQQFPAIMPKEVIDAADASGVKEFIGTGPFQLDEIVPNQYMRLTKFEKYQPRTEPADGLAGNKEALLDELMYYYTPDPSTRINGLASGEYDTAAVPLDALPQIEANKDLVQELNPFGLQTLIFNKKQGVFTDVNMRKAVNLALQKEALMTASFTDSRFYRMDGGLMMSEQTAWYSESGKENYEAYDVEQAKQLIAEAGYNGETIRIITTQQYATLYNAAVVAQQQLREVGLSTELVVMDWATLLDVRTKPDQWEMFFTGFPMSATPIQFPFLDSKAQWPGWTNSEEIDAAIAEMKASATQEEAKIAFDKLQHIFWEEYPVLVIGQYFNLGASTSKVKANEWFNGPLYWKTYLEP